MLPEFWGGRRESNPQRPEPQSGALPVELLPPRLAIITSGEADWLQQSVSRGLIEESAERFTRGLRRHIRIPWRGGELSRADFLYPQ